VWRPCFDQLGDRNAIKFGDNVSDLQTIVGNRIGSVNSADDGKTLDEAYLHWKPALAYWWSYLQRTPQVGVPIAGLGDQRQQFPLVGFGILCQNDSRYELGENTVPILPHEILTRMLSLKEAGKLDAPEGRSKIDTLADSYKLYARNSAPKSADWIDLVWRVHLEPFFGGFFASRIGTDKLQEYIAERQEAGAKNSTINRELAILKAMFNNGSNCDPPKILRIPRFPSKLDEPNPRSGFLTDEQYGKLRNACKHQWLLAMMSLAYTFGFRKSELMGLRVCQVDLTARTVRLLPGETKNDKGRTIVMTAEVYREISERLKGKSPDDLIFTWENGDPVLDFRAAWDNMCTAAGVQVLLHDFRRTAVRNMVRAGISENVAMKISGHKTRSVFDRYASLTRAI
jgi:integrase